MILHLLFDDKFAEYAIKQFSEYEMCSEMVMFTDAEPSLSPYYGRGIQLFRVGVDNLNGVIERLGKYKAVVFHGLFYPWQETVLRAVPQNVKVAWVFWGGDIYGRRDLSKRFLSPISKCLLSVHSLKNRLQGKSDTIQYEIPKDLLKRIDYCLTDVPEDYSFVKQYLGMPIKELWYNYYSIEETVGDLMDSVVDGSNVLIGNSCTIECNHLDGFRALRSFVLGKANVVVPLSYGKPWLKNLLLREGRRRFGEHFYPLTDFLPRDEYNRIIKSCAVAIMPHYRQQAFGNIITALWLGTRVYLSEKNLLFSFFKRIGTHVFSLEHDLRKSNPVALLPLSDEEREQNRRTLRAIYSREVMHQKNLDLVKVLNQ